MLIHALMPQAVDGADVGNSSVDIDCTFAICSGSSNEQLPKNPSLFGLGC